MKKLSNVIESLGNIVTHIMLVMSLMCLGATFFIKTEPYLIYSFCFMSLYELGMIRSRLDKK